MTLILVTDLLFGPKNILSVFIKLRTFGIITFILIAVWSVNHKILKVFNTCNSYF
jgi:hypothetical protein